MKVKDYKDLNIWKTGIEIADLVYEIASNFPKEEKYGLVSQMQRSAVSIPSNVAEGFARQYSKEYKQFLYVSLGSCAELETQAIVAKKRNYMSQDEFERLVEKLSCESKMLVSLAKLL